MPDSAEGASPKSPRYFYTDPLAAAWMAKHFGLEFLVKQGNGFRRLRDSEYLTAAHIKRSVRYFVADDSLHLLEPRKGDLVTCIGVAGWMIDRIHGRIYYTHNAAGLECSGKIEEATIIQRNGIAFHSPDREAA